MSALRPSAVRSAVRRPSADRHLRLMLLTFAASVLGTRAYLALTGYPQVGGEVLHIAHALWGGLLLVVASVLPLVVANRWVYSWVAVLSGLGTGLFVDEVGKFITQENDYFFPAAAPIVYAVFLLTGVVYLRVRRPPARDARAELYAALEGMEDVLDHDLDADEREELQAVLDRAVAGADTPQLRRLAEALREFVVTDARVVPARLGRVSRLRAALADHLGPWLTEPRLRWAVVLGLAALGGAALRDAAAIVAATVASPAGPLDALAAMTDRLAAIDVGEQGLPVLLARAVLEAGVGALLLVAAWLLATGRRGAAVRLAQYVLLVAIAVVDVLVFYFEQFLAAVGAAAQFAVLGLVSAYGRRRPPAQQPPPGMSLPSAEA